MTPRLQTCPTCNGRGSEPTGEAERSTGYALEDWCITCGGTGEVDSPDDPPEPDWWEALDAWYAEQVQDSPEHVENWEEPPC